MAAVCLYAMIIVVFSKAHFLAGFFGKAPFSYLVLACAVLFFLLAMTPPFSGALRKMDLCVLKKIKLFHWSLNLKRYFFTGALTAIICFVIFLTYHYFKYRIELIRTVPLDVQKSDILPAIQIALSRFTQFQFPYAVYKLPWETPLVYQPLLWMSFLPAHLAGIDLRWMTVFFLLALILMTGGWLIGRAFAGTAYLFFIMNASIPYFYAFIPGLVLLFFSPLARLNAMIPRQWSLKRSLFFVVPFLVAMGILFYRNFP